MKKIIIIVYSVFICLLLVASVSINSSEHTCTTYQGFAFDQEQNLYLGKDNVISVIDTNGNQIRTLCVPTSRGYKFTILNNNYILIYTGPYFYKMDLLGNNLQTIHVTDENRKIELMMSYRRFVSVDGTEYVMRNRLFRPCIYRIELDEEVMVYEMPTPDYVAKLMEAAFLINLFVVVLIIVCEFRKSKKRYGDL